MLPTCQAPLWCLPVCSPALLSARDACLPIICWPGKSRSSLKAQLPPALPAPPPCCTSIHCACGPVQTMNVEEMGCFLFILFLFFFFGVYSFEDTDTHYFNSLSISPLASPLLERDSDTPKMQILPLKSFPSAKGGEPCCSTHVMLGLGTHCFISFL